MATQSLLCIVLGTLLAASAVPCFAAEASTRDLFVHAVDSAGAPVQPALVTTSDVAASQRREASTPGFEVRYFQLTASAAQRMSTYSSQNVGRPLAVFCGSEEVSRPITRTVFSSLIVVSLPVQQPAKP